jgi:protein-disulfide isomerase/uncharacterized membrane protein
MNKTIAEFLTYLQIPVSEAYCEKLISSHSDFPSMLSIVDTLERLGIRYIVGEIQKDKIDELDFPYILQTSKKYNEILVIKSNKDLIINKEVLKYWEGVVLHVEPTASIIDKENNRVYRKEKSFQIAQGVLLATLAILISWAFVKTLSPVLSPLFVTSIAGILTGYLLMAKELGVKYKVVEKFCTSGKNSDCDKVLDSDIGKFIGGITLSNLVLTYFLFQTTILSIVGTTDGLKSAHLTLLGILSFFLIQVAAYSVYYQYQKAKSWCKLCLIVNGIIVVQFLLFGYLFLSPVFDFTIHVTPIFLQAAIFVAFGCICLMVKHKIEILNNLNNVVSSASRVKNNVQVFTSLLKKQREVNTTLMEHEVLIGDRNAPIKIVMVSNLYCKPCKNQHEVLAELIDTFPDKVLLALRFVISKDEAANNYLIQYWLRFIHLKKDESFFTQKLLHDWYVSMDLKKFQEIYPMELTTSPELGVDIVRRHNRWGEQIGISFTPTFFINGYQMPKNYDIADLFFLVPSLSDQLAATSDKKNIDLVVS